MIDHVGRVRFEPGGCAKVSFININGVLTMNQPLIKGKIKDMMLCFLNLREMLIGQSSGWMFYKTRNNRKKSNLFRAKVRRK